MVLCHLYMALCKSTPFWENNFYSSTEYLSETWYKITKHRLTVLFFLLIIKNYYEFKSYSGQYRIPKWDEKPSNIYQVPPWYKCMMYIHIYVHTWKLNRRINISGREEHTQIHSFKPSKGTSRQLSVINKPCLTINRFFPHWFHYNQVFTSELKYCELLLMCHLHAALLKEKIPTYMLLAEMVAD